MCVGGKLQRCAYKRGFQFEPHVAMTGIGGSGAMPIDAAQQDAVASLIDFLG